MFNKKVQNVMAASLLTLACACSEDAANNVTQEPDLNGRYQGACVSADLANLSYQEVLRFEADASFTQIREYFTSEDCKADGSQGALMLEGTYRVDNDGAPDSEGGAIRVELKTARVEVDTDGLATALNTANFCGQDSYAAGSSTEITEGTDDALCPVRDLPDTLYGVYREDDGTLYLNSNGVGGMAEAQADRPKDLDQDTPFVKQ